MDIKSIERLLLVNNINVMEKRAPNSYRQSLVRLSKAFEKFSYHQLFMISKLI